MKKQRPVNLDLTTIRLPVVAVTSILHRISGVIGIIAVGILLWLFGLSLSSAEGFLQAAAITKSIIVKLILWGILTALLYHTVAGIRHMLMDFGLLNENLQSGRYSAQIVIIVSIVLSVLAGVYLW